MENLIWDLMLVAPLHIVNDLVFLVMRFKLLGALHAHDRPISEKLFGANRTYLGAAVIITAATAMYSFLLGGLCILPGIGMATGTYLNSFIKRRMGIKDGGRLIVFDQLDFFIGGVAGLALCGVYLDNFLLMASLSMMLHIASNVFAYVVGIKEVWW